MPPASPLSQLQPTFRAEYGGLLRCRRCSRCLPASGQAGHRLGGCQVAWGARELRRRRPSQTPQWTPGRVPSAALPEAAAAFPSGLIVHVVVFCAGMNVSVVRSAGGGRWSNPPSPPGASRVRGGVLHRIYDEYGSQKARHTRFLALFQPQLTCLYHGGGWLIRSCGYSWDDEKLRCAAFSSMRWAGAPRLCGKGRS